MRQLHELRSNEVVVSHFQRVELTGVENCTCAIIVRALERDKNPRVRIPLDPKNATAFFSGANGSRTRVQTRNTYAFYTLILAFIFVRKQDPSHQPPTYLLNLRNRIAACNSYSVYSCAAIPVQPTDPAWSDVSFRRLAPKYANLLYFD